MYSKRGSNINSSWSQTSTPFRYGYVSMPLLLGWHPFKNASLLLGAEPGYMVWHDADANGNFNGYTLDNVDRRWNIDIELGLSYQPLPRWTIEARAMAGLIGMYDELEFRRISRTIYNTGIHSGYHTTIQLGLCYELKTGKTKTGR